MSDKVKVGMKFDKLTVVKRIDDYKYPNSNKREPKWLCICNCDEHNEIEVIQHNLLNGHTHCCKSCRKNSFKDITGMKFGKLTVIKQGPFYITPTGKKEIQWYCNCDCGKTDVLVRGHNLRNGHTTSCGCAQVEASTKHGYHGTDIYSVFSGMKDRCLNPNSPAYKWYGARGIKICDEWLDEENGRKRFCDWAMTHGYEKGLSIERINTNGNYCPENCTFKNGKAQANNRRNNVNLTYKGETHTVAEWAELLHINAFNIYNRLDLGWTVEKALETPVNDYIRRFTNSKGETHTLSEWSKIVGINSDTIYDRIRKSKMSVDDALYTPVAKVPNIIEYNNISASMRKWENALGFKESTISRGIKNGKNIAEIVEYTRNNDKSINGVYFLDENDKPISQDDYFKQ